MSSFVCRKVSWLNYMKTDKNDMQLRRNNGKKQQRKIRADSADDSFSAICFYPNVSCSWRLWYLVNLAFLLRLLRNSTNEKTIPD